MLYCSYPNGTQIEDFEARKYSEAAEGMNCHCARARYILSESATGKPKCCKNGNYRPWQCIGSTCYCVDEIGRQVVGPNMDRLEVPDNLVQTLICHDTDTVC